MDKVKFVNLTPHDVVLRTIPDNVPYRIHSDIVIPSSGVARVDTVAEPVNCEWSPVPVIMNVFGKVHGLPPQEAGTAFLVSLIVLEHVKHRNDILAPATGPNDGCVRDSKGMVVAVRKLVMA